MGLPAVGEVPKDAIDSLKAALSTVRRGPPGTARQVDEARLLFYVAHMQDGPTEERRQEYVEGRDLAGQAREREPQNPAAIFWWAANEGGIADLDKNLAALGTLARLERELLALKRAHPDYGYDAADRTLGTIYAAAPGFISIGSNRKAETCFQEAVQRFPDFPGNQLAWAKFLQGRGQAREAAQIASKVQNNPDYRSKHFGEFEMERPLWEADIAMLLSTEKAHP